MKLNFFASLLVLVGNFAYAVDFELKKGDHICIVGGTMAERMQHFGSFEAALHARYPDAELVVRNLAYSGDEIDGFSNNKHRMRSMDFGSFDQWLAGSAPCPQPNKLSPRDLDKVRENRFASRSFLIFRARPLARTIQMPCFERWICSNPISFGSSRIANRSPAPRRQMVVLWSVPGCSARSRLRSTTRCRNAAGARLTLPARWRKTRAKSTDCSTPATNRQSAS